MDNNDIKMSIWNDAKWRLFPAFVSAGKGDGLPHRNCLGFDVILMIMSRDGSYMSEVTYEKIDAFGVSVDEAFRQAIISGEKLMPLNIIDTAKLLRACGLEPPDAYFQMYAITNSRTMYGASAILYDGALEEIRDAIGGDYYLVPSSIHEMMAFKKDDGIPDMGQTLLEINAEINSSAFCVAKEDVLATAVYEYSNGSLKKASVS